jgi:lipoprotein-anchoring transpeptidase ErfK/SrfK
MGGVMPTCSTESRTHGPALNRRSFVIGAPLALAGCVTASTTPQRTTAADPAYARKVVPYETREAAGTIIVDPSSHHLYLVQGGGRALQYGVGVGKEGFAWSGVAFVHDKQEWPDWYPPKEMLQRKPDIMKAMMQLQGGLGMSGGPDNPLGARALYLWQGKADTLYRIHGTNEPWTIGQNVSSGCIRLTNDDVTDLYDRAAVGSKVIVLASSTA